MYPTLNSLCPIQNSAIVERNIAGCLSGCGTRLEILEQVADAVGWQVVDRAEAAKAVSGERESRGCETDEIWSEKKTIA